MPVLPHKDERDSTLQIRNQNLEIPNKHKGTNPQRPQWALRMTACLRTQTSNCSIQVEMSAGHVR